MPRPWIGVGAAAASLWLSAGVAGAGSLPAAAGARHRPVVSDLLITATEFHLQLSRAGVPAGTVDVELLNRGQDAHDVQVQRLGPGSTAVGPVLAQVPVTQSGGLTRAVWRLRAGRYELFCSLPGHAGMGMHAVLRVS